MIGVAIFPGGNQPSARAGGAGHGAQAGHGPRLAIAQLKIGNGNEVQPHRRQAQGLGGGQGFGAAPAAVGGAAAAEIMGEILALAWRAVREEQNMHRTPACGAVGGEAAGAGGFIIRVGRKNEKRAGGAEQAHAGWGDAWRGPPAV